MRVKACDHTFHGAFEQLGIGFVLIIVGSDLAVYLRHRADGLYRQGFFFFCLLGCKAL